MVVWMKYAWSTLEIKHVVWEEVNWEMNTTKEYRDEEESLEKSQESKCENHHKDMWTNLVKSCKK